MNCRYQIAALVLLPALFLAGCGKEEAAKPEVVRPIRAIKAADATVLISRSFPGRAKATQEVDLSFRVSGPLITRPVNVGDEVKAGDVLARIDPRDYEVELRNIQGQLDKAQAALERAQSDYQRIANIRKQDPGAASEASLDRAQENRDGAQAQIKALQASVDAAKDALSYTYLKAPYDGGIVAIYVENFEHVRAKQPIARLLDTSRVEMIVNIPENLISLTPYVKNIHVEFDTFPGRKIPAGIKEVGREASQTTRTYPITLIMDQPEDIKILPGMAGKASGTARPLEQSAQTGIEIPVSAVFSPTESNDTYVWVIDEQTKTVQQRQVQAGELTGRGIKITAGLEPGEWIATAGAHTLREGQKVRLLQEPGS